MTHAIVQPRTTPSIRGISLLPRTPKGHSNPGIFWVSEKFVPLQPDGEASQDIRIAPVPPLRVVIVEDEPIIAMELETLLVDLGAAVVGIASSAVEADELITAYRPDLVTMDINIKGDRDGVSAALGIFELYGIRPIFISASSDVATRQRAEPCNAIAWLKKPINPPDLAAAVNGLKLSEN